MEGTGSMVWGWGSELFSGLRSVTRVHFCMCFHHTDFVCGSAIDVDTHTAIAVHRILFEPYWIYAINYSLGLRVCSYTVRAYIS